MWITFSAIASRDSPWKHVIITFYCITCSLRNMWLTCHLLIAIAMHHAIHCGRYSKTFFFKLQTAECSHLRLVVFAQPWWSVARCPGNKIPKVQRLPSTRSRSSWMTFPSLQNRGTESLCRSGFLSWEICFFGAVTAETCWWGQASLRARWTQWVAMC